PGPPYFPTRRSSDLKARLAEPAVRRGEAASERPAQSRRSRRACVLDRLVRLIRRDALPRGADVHDQLGTIEAEPLAWEVLASRPDRKSTRLNSSHLV